MLKVSTKKRWRKRWNEAKADRTFSILRIVSNLVNFVSQENPWVYIEYTTAFPDTVLWFPG